MRNTEKTKRKISGACTFGVRGIRRLPRRTYGWLTATRRRKILSSILAILMVITSIRFAFFNKPKQVLAAKMELTETSDSITIDVRRRYRVVMEKGDTSDYLTFYDRYENNSVPNEVIDFRGASITDENVEYNLRWNDSRKTTVLESTNTRVVVRIEGCLDTTGGGSCLKDADGGNDNVIEAIENYTFTPDGIFLNVEFNFKDGLEIDSVDYNDGVGSFAFYYEGGAEHEEAILHGDGETEGTPTTGSASISSGNADQYMVLQGTGNYQDIIFGEGSLNGNRVLHTSSYGQYYRSSATQDRVLMFDRPGAGDPFIGKDNSYFYLLFKPQSELDSEAEREGVFNDIVNPDTLSFTTGDLWDDKPISSGGTATSSAVLFHSGFEGGDSNLCDGGDGWTNGNCEGSNEAVGNESTTVYDGTYAARFESVGTEDAASAVKTFSYSHDIIYARIYFNLYDNNLTDGQYVQLIYPQDVVAYDGPKAGVELNGTDLELFFTGTTGGTQLAGSDGIIQPNTWYSLEMRAYRHATQGTADLWLNGKHIYSGTGFDNGDYDWGRIWIGHGYSQAVENQIFMDDVVISESYIGTAPYNEGQGAYTVDAASNHAEFDIDAGGNVSDTLAGAEDSGSTEIVLATSDNFPDSGVAYIEGDKFTYTTNTVGTETLSGIPATGENGITYHADGSVVSRPQRHSPSVKMRGYRDNTLPDEAVLEGERLQRNYDYIADIKPFSTSYFADELTWYSTLEDSSSVTSPDVGDAGSSSGTDYIAGKYGSAARFDDNSEYVSINTATNFDKNNGALDFWYRPSYASTDNSEHNLIGFINSNDTFQVIKEDNSGGECNSNANCLVFVINEDASNRRAVYFTTSDYSWSSYDWVHIRATWDETLSSSDLNLYLNGVAATNRINNGSYTATNLSVPATLYIGNDTSSGSEEANGLIDEFHLYDAAASSPTPTTLTEGGNNYRGNEYLANENNDYSLAFVDDDASNRAEYIWLGSDSAFSGVNVDLETNGVGSSENFDWEYWDGTAWSALSVTEQETGASEWLADGNFYFIPPPDWIPYSVNGSTDLYYIRGHLEGGSYSTTPVENKVLTDIVTFQYTRYGGTVSSENMTFEIPGWASGAPPVAHWKFDEGYGTTANDSISNTYPLTIKDATWQEESLCVSGKCLHFDGSQDQASRSAQLTQLDFKETNSFTLSGWFKHPSSVTGTDTLISKFESAGSDGGYKVYMDSSGYVCAGVDDDNTWGPDDSACSFSSYADSKWHHFSAVIARSGSDEAILYIDGNRVGYDDNIAATATLENNDGFYIGADEGGYQNYWDGFIDEVKVYRYARSEAEIKVDYVGGAAVFGDEDAWLSDGLVGYWKMDESSVNSCSGGEDSCDSSGNGNEGTYEASMGTSNQVSGKYDNSVEFDGTDDYVQAAADPSIDEYGKTEMTIIAWVYANSDGEGDRGRIVDKKDDLDDFTGVGYNLYVGNESGSKVRLLSSIGHSNTHAAAFGSYASDSMFAINEWHHVAMVYNKGGDKKIQLYVDGKIIELDSNTAGVGTLEDDSAVNLRIGNYAGDTSRTFAGEIDETRIYNRALSPAEVQDLYEWAPGPIGYWNFDENQGTNAFDTSGNNNTATLGFETDTEATWTPGKHGSALDFNGTSDNAGITNPGSNWDFSDGGLNAGTNSFTLGAWVYIPSNITNADPTIIANGGGANDQAGYWFKYDQPSGNENLELKVCDGTGADRQNFDSSLNLGLNDDTWHYVAVTYVYDSDGSNGTAEFFVDGVFINSDSITKLDDSTSGSSDVEFGAKADASTTYWDGNIDDIRIYSYIRTQEQIVEDMNAGHPAPGSPVGSSVLHYKFDEGYGDTVNDSSPNNNNGDLGGSGNTCPAAGATLCPAWSNSGKIGKALDFGGTGTDDLIDLGTDTSTNNIFAGGGTFAAWIYPRSAGEGNYGRIADKASNTDGADGWGVEMNANDHSVRIERGFSGSRGVWRTNSNVITPNQWNYVTVTYNEDSNVNDAIIYVNGVDIGTNEFITPTGDASTDVAQDLIIGNFNDGSRTFDGFIDEVELYDSALSESQIKLLYNQGKAAVWGATSTDSSDNASWSALNEYCPPGQDSSCTAPIGEWKFDENTGTSTIYDTSENAYDGTLANIVESDWVPGKHGSALYFDGTTDKRVLNTSPPNLTSAWTIGAWIYITQASASDKYIIDFDTNEVGMRYTTTDDLRCTANQTNVITTTGSLLSVNKWHYVNCVYDGSNMYAYVDGVQVDEAIYSTDTNTVTDMEVGINVSTSNFEGNIDNVVVYNYARTPAQISWSYNQGGPVGWWKLDECSGDTVYDSSGNGNNGTITPGGAPNTAVGTCTSGNSAHMWYNGATGKRNASLDFDGVDDEIDAGDQSELDMGTSDISIAAWVKLSSATTVSYPTIVAKGGGAVDEVGYWFFYHLADNAIKMYLSGNSPGDARSLTVSGDNSLYLDDDTWHHIAITTVRGAADTSYFYVDGKLLAIDSDTTDASESIDTTESFGIGNKEGISTTIWEGQLDDVRIYSYTLTPQQIRGIISEGALRFGPDTGSP